MSISEKLDAFFHVSERGSTIHREILAGITTFMTMAYILLVNPAILGKAGVPPAGVVTATALSASLATLMMGLYANAPYALAPGMGLNAYFAYSVVPFVSAILAVRGLDDPDPWKIALAAVLVEGIVFILLSVTRARESVANSIPTSLKYSIAAGIGLFLTLIGFEDAGLVTGNPATLLSFNISSFTKPGPIIALVFVLVAGALMALRIPGALLISILLAALTSWALGVSPPPSGVVSRPDFSATLQLDLQGLASLGLATATAIVFTFFMVDFFDTLGTVTGLSAIAGLLDEKGRVKGIGRMLLTDATGTTIGALLGTSTVTTYIESAAGVEEGGRTGLTAIIVGLLFLLGLFFAPVFTSTPAYATAPALIIVGLLMAQAITRVNLKDPTEAIPAFLTIAGIPFTFSIADGMALGFISYVALKAVTGRWRELNPILVGVALLFLAYFLSLPHIQSVTLKG
ncbi:MAG: NCS2 family permease [Desulfurococcales archaeon]|nr:NCS2 family permease [Desulfurococcales archaeon]